MTKASHAAALMSKSCLISSLFLQGLNQSIANSLLYLFLLFLLFVTELQTLAWSDPFIEISGRLIENKK